MKMMRRILNLQSFVMMIRDFDEKTFVKNNFDNEKKTQIQSSCDIHLKLFLLTVRPKDKLKKVDKRKFYRIRRLRYAILLKTLTSFLY